MESVSQKVATWSGEKHAQSCAPSWIIFYDDQSASHNGALRSFTKFVDQQETRPQCCSIGYPTAKVASSAQFLHHIRHRMQHTAAAQTHFGDRRHRQLRWRSFIKRQQAYTAICKEITGGSKETVVAYGDAKFSSSCCKGNPSTPTVSLRRKLGHCCQVYDMDEFRTSKLCCACKTAVDGRTPACAVLTGFITCTELHACV